MEKIDTSNSTELYGRGVMCDSCGIDDSKCEIFWHCPKELNSSHQYGNDICYNCAFGATEVTSIDQNTNKLISNDLSIAVDVLSSLVNSFENPVCVCKSNVSKIANNGRMSCSAC